MSAKIPKPKLWGIYNTAKKEFQFPSIAEPSAKQAQRKLTKLIGHAAKKWRFEPRVLPDNS